ncbi:MAG: alpha/beta hydrolase [Deltaproteobacteria bacterium]|nr:alpha/beta hydrolase [Kofleriaceae bacterium]
MTARAVPDRSGELDDARTGWRIHWDHFGRRGHDRERGRETIVFMNGLGMATDAWYTSVPRVHPEFDVLLFDYPGQGRSTRRDDPCTIPQICELVARILDRLEIDRVHTQGVSYGGFVTADFGRLFPDRVLTQTLSGVLLSSTHSFRMYQELSLAFYAQGAAAFDLYTRYLYEKIFSERFLTRIHDKVERMRTKFHDSYRDQTYCLTRLTEAQDALLAALPEHLDGYRAVTAPTVVIAGEHDRAVPAWMQEALAAIYPASRFVLLPGCGHLTYFEEPDAFWGHLRALARAKSIAYRTEA